MTPKKRLTASELNGETCIDLCFGRWLSFQVSVTGSGMAARDYAKDVLSEAEGWEACVLAIGALCQPLGAFPWLRDWYDRDTACEPRALSHSSSSYTWDAGHWLPVWPHSLKAPSLLGD